MLSRKNVKDALIAVIIAEITDTNEPQAGDIRMIMAAYKPKLKQITVKVGDGTRAALT